MQFLMISQDPDMLEKKNQQFLNLLSQTVLMIPINPILLTIFLPYMGELKLDNWPANPENNMKIPENFRKYLSNIYTAMVKRWG